MTSLASFLCVLACGEVKPRQLRHVTPYATHVRPRALLQQTQLHYSHQQGNNRTIHSAVTIISVFGWRYIPYCMCEQCNKFNSVTTIRHNGLHLASCNATYTILHLAQGSEVTLVFYKYTVYNNGNIHATVYSATINKV